jgi:hypothetical protein
MRGPVEKRPKGASRMRWEDLDAVAPAHQYAILGSAQMGNADGEPNPDCQERHGKCESRNVGQHPVSKIVWFFPVALVTREIVGYLELVHRLAGSSAVSGCRRHRARPELEHAGLFVFQRG